MIREFADADAAIPRNVGRQDAALRVAVRLGWVHEGQPAGIEGHVLFP